MSTTNKPSSLLPRTRREPARLSVVKWTWGLAVSIAIWAAGSALGGWTMQAGEHAAAAVEPASGVQAPAQPPPCGYGCILGRNLAVYVWLLCGLVSGGLTTVAVLAFNGVVLGQIVNGALDLGMSSATVARLVLPHGVPELAAFAVAGAIGLQGASLLRAWLHDLQGAETLNAVWRPALVGALLLPVAAGIEVGVTVPLAACVGHLE